MSSPAILNAAAPPVDPQALRIVLFGMPDAGKSSLLGALAQAAQTQERVLQGRLTDSSHGLAELQRRVYDEKPRETLEEIVPYPVTYEPFVGQKPDPTRRQSAVLYDCDGRAANEILTRRRDLGDAAGKLGDAILRADALILVVDAAATAEQIESDFGEFTKFLEFFERQRGRRSDVGGLPVYLVLAKCDLLRKPGEPLATWAEHIEERKKDVLARFKEFVDDEGPTVFGSIDLEVAATAVRRPVAPSAPPSREPLGVAELFRHCLQEATDYRQRAVRSQRRLTLTVGGVVAAAVLLAGGATGLYMTHDQLKQSPLAAAVEGYRAREGRTAAERLSEPLQRKVSELSGIQQNPEFEKLPQDLKEFVNQRLGELIAYRKYREQLYEVRPPGDLRSLEELNQLEAQLRDRYAPPADYAEEWRGADAVLLRERWLGDIAAVRSAANEMDNWFGELRAEAARLLYLSDRPGERTALPWPVWHEQLGKLLAQADSPPHRPTDRLPNPKSAKQALTYETVYKLSEVSRSQRDWEEDRQKLLTLRDITQALGLVPETAERRALLRVPDPPTADDIHDRVEALKRQYPRSAEWAVSRLPDAVAPDIRAAARASYDRMVEFGRGIVHRALMQRAPDGVETHARWLAVTEWLPEAPELRDWRELAVVLQRLMSNQPEDPVAALATFLKEPSFNLKFSGLRLHVPDDAPAPSLRPDGNLTIIHLVGDARTVLAFVSRSSNHDPVRRVTTFSFVPEGLDRLTFTPGDQLWAELNLRDADSSRWKMSWLQSRSYGAYSFERLVRTPRLYPADEPDAYRGVLPKGVYLTITPENGVPRVPDLLPTVPKPK
ncbi:MAG: hypothetical protein ACJ8F7_03365 [Gemmataceae bacterium]